MAYKYEANPLTTVIEHETGITDLSCDGLHGNPDVERYKKTNEQPWPVSADTTFSCTWISGDERVDGKLRIIPEFTPYREKSVSGLNEAQLLSENDTIWVPASGSSHD